MIYCLACTVPNSPPACRVAVTLRSATGYDLPAAFVILPLLR